MTSRDKFLELYSFTAKKSRLIDVPVKESNAMVFLKEQKKIVVGDLNSNKLCILKMS
jgi:hypothetical protein